MNRIECILSAFVFDRSVCRGSLRFVRTHSEVTARFHGNERLFKSGCLSAFGHSRPMPIGRLKRLVVVFIALKYCDRPKEPV